MKRAKVAKRRETERIVGIVYMLVLLMTLVLQAELENVLI